MAQSWFGKLSLLVLAWPKSIRRGLRPGHNRGTAAIAEPARLHQVKHGFLLQRNTVMLGIFLILALAACQQVFWPLEPLPKPENPPTQMLGVNAQPTRPLVALNDYLSMARKRELFKPSVPLPAENKLGQTTAEELAKRFKFLGVSGSGADLSALVAVANASVQSVRQGEHLEDFVVKEINSGQLVLELNEDTVILKR